MDLSPKLLEKHQQELRHSRIKLFVMIGALAVVIVAMCTLGRQDGGGTRGTGGEPGAPEKTDLSKIKPETPPPGVGPEHAPPGKPSKEVGLSEDEVEQKFPTINDPRTLDQIRDQDTDLEAGALYHLAHRVYREPPEKLKAEADPKPDWAALWEHSPAARAKAIAVRGQIVALWPQPLRANPWGIKEFWAYRVRPENIPVPPPLSTLQPVPAPPGEAPDIPPPGQAAEALALPKEQVEAKFPFLADPKTLDQARDQGTEVEAAPLFFLLHRVAQDPPEKLKGEADPKLDWTALWKEPSAARGKAVVVRGQVVRLWSQPVGENPLGVKELWVYRVRAEGAPPEGKASLYDVYAIEKLKGALAGDTVTVYGRFLKARVAEPEAAEASKVQVAVVAARRLEPLAYLNEPRMPAPIVDGKPPEGRALFWLLKRVRESTMRDLRTGAEPNAALSHPAFLEAPARHRGKVVAIAGDLQRILRISLPDNPLGLPDVYYGQVVDQDGKTATFYCFGVADDVRLNEPVTVYGYYLKNWTTTTQGAEVTSPVVVARQLVAWYTRASQLERGYFYDVYSIEKLKGAMQGDQVTAYGRFLKARLIEPERMEDQVELQAAIVIARRLEPLTYLDDLKKMPGPVVDGKRVEPHPFYWLLKKARDIPFDQLRAQAEANAHLTHLDLTNNPERHRGKPIVMRGGVRNLIRISLPENLLDMPDVYYGQLVDGDRKMHTFYCIGVPEGIHLHDSVLLYGYFLKKWSYTSVGNYEMDTPVFVAKLMQVIAYERGHFFEIVLLVTVAATAVAIVIGTLAGRAYGRSAAEARYKRHQERMPGNINELAKRQAAAARGEQDDKKPEGGGGTPGGSPA
jgi:hypothetical protein